MKACSRPDTQPERLTDLAAYLLRYLAARRAIQIQNRAGRHNAVGVDSVVAAVIVLLDVVEIYRSGNTGPLIQFAGIAPYVFVVGQRSEERHVGKECVRPCRARRWPSH